ncbi:CPBP family intramembrane glutamic endopeptidase [Paenibacillus sp. HW567]|uniref:CPBP family intramembrane glutamic endopeptidase n=1 Tax=Paenibacillus sp. HW567 TaxID=1034769 RepID=UPI00037F4133|nr:CPBP family intramembrane glutamic endopeptidase [Paenibacillus sp. HW567]
MKENTAKGHPVLFSIMLGVVLILLVSVASAAASIMELDDTGVRIAQACAFFVMAVIVSVYMTRKGRSLASFGFKKLNPAKTQQVLYYIPLLIIALFQPAMNGINFDLSVTEVVSILLMTVLVGFTEETIFRGILREKLRLKGPVFYIVFSSVFFGILHMANALNGTEFIHILLQVINALLLGCMLALLIETADNIIPLIAFHFIYDALAMVSNENLDQEILLVSLLNILYFLYGIYLVVVLLRRKQSHHLSA